MLVLVLVGMAMGGAEKLIWGWQTLARVPQTTSTTHPPAGNRRITGAKTWKEG